MSCERQRWLILGCSPTMPGHVDTVYKWADRILTTNAGVWEVYRQMQFGWRCADVYACIEVETPRRYARHYSVLRTRYGMQLLTVDRSISQNNIDLDAPDIVLRVPCDDFDTYTPWEPGGYVPCSSSGGYLLQYAVNQGAAEIWMVGMDGYLSTPSTRVPDTYDGQLGPKYGMQRTRNLYFPVIQDVISRSPQVQFVQYGKPVLQLHPADGTSNYRRVLKPGDGVPC